MSHHGNQIPEDFSSYFRPKQPTMDELRAKVEAAEKQFGATGRYPDGKLNENDEGEISLGIATHEGKVIMNFGDNPIKWIGFTKEQAKIIGEALIKKSEEIEIITG